MNALWSLRLIIHRFIILVSPPFPMPGLNNVVGFFFLVFFFVFFGSLQCVYVGYMGVMGMYRLMRLDRICLHIHIFLFTKNVC